MDLSRRENAMLLIHSCMKLIRQDLQHEFNYGGRAKESLKDDSEVCTMHNKPSHCEINNCLTMEGSTRSEPSVELSFK